MKIHTITTEAFQGDLYLRQVDKIPVSHKPATPDEGKHIVAHSETGHHHYFHAVEEVELFRDPNDEMVCYLRIEGESDLIHARDYDTHETLRLTKGVWELRRQREYTPEGWRRVED